MTDDKLQTLAAALLLDADFHGKRATGASWEHEGRTLTHLTNAAEALGALLARAQRAEAIAAVLASAVEAHANGQPEPTPEDAAELLRDVRDAHAIGGWVDDLQRRAGRAEAELAALRRAGRDGNGAMNAVEILTADRDDWKRRAERAEAEVEQLRAVAEAAHVLCVHARYGGERYEHFKDLERALAKGGA